MKVELKVLIEKLNPLARGALESAAELCVRQSNYNVELEHYLRTVLDRTDSDVQVILRQYDVDQARLLDELTRAIESFARGNTRTPALSPNIPRLLERAWSVASLQLGGQQIRSGTLLVAALTDSALRGVLQESAPSLLHIPRDRLEADLGELLAHSPEGPAKLDAGRLDAGRRDPGAPSRPNEAASASASPSASSTPPASRASARGPDSALDRFTIDLTALARAGGIDPIRGRDAEIRQIIDILMRRRQNNPILTGEPGVGKTAVVEGFALRVAAGQVPENLRGASVRTLDLGLLQAGAGVKGEFEHRLKTVINEVHSSPVPIILFIDEAHTIIGAGGAEGQGDAANLLKPALARGELRTIAATTWSEYKKYVEKDPALARRFQVIKVEEPDESTATEMLRGMVAHLERHHGVRITDAALRSAVELSHRHISGRQLPDKAISVIDTACARVAIGQSSAPRQVEDAAREVQRLEIELAILERELASGADHEDRIEQLRSRLARARLAQLKLEERWHEEAGLVRRLNTVQALLEGDTPPEGEALDDVEELDDPSDVATLNWKRDELTRKLEALRDGEVLVPVCVDDDMVAAVISDWTGIPVGKMVKNEIRTVISLRTRMQDRIIGQNHALEAIARRIGTSSAHLEDPQKPSGVFLLVGPSGVGKTETAVTLADFLYGGERNMITVNMSEYQEAHTVSSLKGAPPGYVGYGSGGVLTEAVRRRPYSVVLLDEVEKAHPDVLELFYQVFDKGFMEDGEGQHIDFRHTIILLTSNVGSDTIIRACQSSEGGLPQPDELIDHIRPELRAHFPAAFLGRLVVVPYLPLQDSEIGEIVRLKMARVQKRFWERHGAELTFDPEVVDLIAQRCTEVDSGARNIDHILSDGILPELSVHVLEEMAEGRRLAGVHIGVAEPGVFTYDLAAHEVGR